MAYAVGERVKILLARGIISPDVYLVETDANSGDIKLIKESTISWSNGGPDKDLSTANGTRMLVNSARVFPVNIEGYAPVIHNTPDDAVAHCPTCAEQHHISHEDTKITCTKHGDFTLYRTKEHVAKVKKSATVGPAPSRSQPRLPVVKETVQMETTTVQPPVTTNAPTEVDAVPLLDIEKLKLIGELYTKRLNFDYGHVSAYGYILFTEVNGTLRKFCFNTYNGSLGKKVEDNALSRFQDTKGSYEVKDKAKAVEAVLAKGYNLVD